jgi:hypothetical protein
LLICRFNARIASRREADSRRRHGGTYPFVGRLELFVETADVAE